MALFSEAAILCVLKVHRDFFFLAKINSIASGRPGSQKMEITMDYNTT